MSLLVVSPSFAMVQLLVDARTGEVLYANKAGIAWHPASLTKLMSAFVTFEAIKAGKVTLDTPVIITSNAIKAPPSRSGLPKNSAITIRDALYIIIVKSANDVSIALAETVSGSEGAFVKEMNQAAKALGMSATNFVNPNGLHNRAQVTSARDMAILALNIKISHKEYAPLFATSFVQLGEKKMKTHNNLLTDFAGTNGMKTGFVCSAGLNIVASVKRNNRSLLAVVLGASSARERGEVVAQLLLRGFSGDFLGRGKSIASLKNVAGSKPKDMRPYLCGENAKAYVAEQKRLYPYGLEGQISFLNDNIAALTYRATNLGKMRNVPLPRKRPFHVALKPAMQNIVIIVPYPIPRPNR